MEISRDEIVEYASRYIEDAPKKDFVLPKGLFCMLHREIKANNPEKEDAKWAFGGYGICQAYHLDTETKPRGKWLFFDYLDLYSFPPVSRTIKLQPPHVVNGLFTDPSRTVETRIVPVPMDNKEGMNFSLKPQDDDKNEGANRNNNGDDNILEFPNKQ